MRRGDKRVYQRAVSELLGVRSSYGHGLSAKIVRAILQAMTATLQRGESINIPGLGKFIVRTRPSKRRAKRFSYQGYATTYIGRDPAKKYVHFIPDRTILRTLNNDCGNTP